MNAPARLSTVADRCAGLHFDAVLLPADRPVARLVAYGLSNMDIATRLNCNEDHVKARLVRVLRATGASTRLQLVVWMYETGRVLPGVLDMPDTPLRPRHVRNEPLTAEHIATLSLPALHHQLTATRATLDRLINLFEPQDPA
ncbi:hypothetical protein [Saccharopolyspora sp. NPDC002578]